MRSLNDVSKHISLQVGMCGMKTDCGGAAGMLGAFYLAVHYENLPMQYTKISKVVKYENFQ